MLFQKQKQKKDLDLNGKFALVTGSSRGIGKAIALLLADNGANVIVNYRKNKKKAEEVVKRIKEKGRESVAVQADLTKKEEVKKLSKKSLSLFNKIDILVNNAGVADYENLIEMDEDIIEDMLDTNLKGLVLLTKEILTSMEKQGQGVIVNISSGAGKSGIPGLATYCATKFGVVGFTEALAREVSRGIRVYAVCPGGVDTDMYHNLFSNTPKMMLRKPETVANKVLECISGRYRNGSAVEV